MPSKAKPVRLGSCLTEAADHRVNQLGLSNFSEYVRSLIRYDCLVGGEDHAVTKPISDQHPDAQDKVDAEILQWLKKGKKGRGVLLEHMIERAIAKGAKTADDVKDDIKKQITK